MLTLLENNIEKAFTGFFSLFEYDYEKSLKFDNISIDSTERKIIYNINNSLIKTNRVIKTSLINMIDTDEELLLSLDKNNIQFKIDCDNDYYIVYDGSLSVVFTNYIQNLQMVKIANLELLVSNFEIVRKQVVNDFIAYYPFTNGSVQDFSGNNNHLTNNGTTATSGLKDEINGARLNNGVNYLASPLLSPKSITFWAYHTSWNILQNTYISSPGGYGDNEYTILQYNNGYFISYNGSSSNQITYALSLNTWYNIALVNIATNQTDLYLNGSKIGTLNKNIQQVKRYFRREGFFSTSADTLLGKLDSIRLYSRIITASEVLQIYNFEK